MASKALVDRVLTVVSAVSAPVIALLIDTGAITATVGVDAGAIIAAAVGAYHSGAAVQRRTLAAPSGTARIVPTMTELVERSKAARADPPPGQN